MGKAGEIVDWGDYSINAPKGDNFVTIALSGMRQSVAIKGDGKLVLWGDGGVPALMNKLANDSFIDAAISGLVVAIRADNHQIEVGGNFVVGNTTTQAVVNPAHPTMKVSAVACGGPHCVVIGLNDQLIYQWGPPTFVQPAHPLHKFTHIRARHDYTIGLDDEGNLYGWGGSYFPFSPSTIPTYLQGWKTNSFIAPLPPPEISLPQVDFSWRRDPTGHLFVPGPFVDLAAGLREGEGSGFPHILALRPNGAVVGWGANTYQQAKAPYGVQFTEIAAGKRYSIGIDIKGEIHYWGGERTGFLEKGPDNLALVFVPRGPFRTISAAGRHAAAVRGFARKRQTSTTPNKVVSH